VSSRSAVRGAFPVEDRYENAERGYEAALGSGCPTGDIPKRQTTTAMWLVVA
jgi:hypothetical protein